MHYCYCYGLHPELRPVRSLFNYTYYKGKVYRCKDQKEKKCFSSNGYTLSCLDGHAIQMPNDFSIEVLPQKWVEGKTSDYIIKMKGCDLEVITEEEFNDMYSWRDE